MTYLVTELCVGGDLKQLLKQKKFFTEDETRHIILSLADAVVYLHKRGNVYHRLTFNNLNIIVRSAQSLVFVVGETLLYTLFFI